ncbi:putative oxoglutarate/iron-dependent dioxygenase, isopenicillin N synthase [Helianthus annuus]|uniref:Isopenicillin N synthase n=1 Tax=Helianthus annuus TaxID=4232 RepID=A0A251TA73_HELAN|nr:uncharacterized protein LOC110889798 [Helianthus annuus]KAF5782654.1 putative isopenicillin N synthase [Helianthus annuus]KAJ0502125.1 putative oxoglutarate/iron-dependent dioxygenase, isopenicillin N synthase [Helianthus annuus]KAJ0510095.1 putative oxoglutarate/iron-dependent dioxygenase, isopenicillin N synthase [Helianthus annuus]KAJ0518045.1 putative oxoglutarate/iron-dependent dioxygenase, isopenicillin N synthase [Helianthus annuus]KAJ0686069.1 putative oxoglutarate/iron-dependent di
MCGQNCKESPIIIPKYLYILVSTPLYIGCSLHSAIDQAMDHIPVIDLTPYVEAASGEFCLDRVQNPELEKVCLEVSRILAETGALLVKDPRCSAEDDDRFISMMEKYFEMPDEFKLLQARPHQHYQNGATPGGLEVPRSLAVPDMLEKARELPKEHQPLIPTGADLKWRYMWRIGPRPSVTRFQDLNSDHIVPEGFPDWEETMNSWGYKLLSAVEAVAEMAAVGFGLPKDAFTNLMKNGPHLLSPTGGDLGSHGKEGTVFAGYHYDLNFLTIHYRSKFPGLYIWLRNGEKVEVKVPEGCLLIQTGKQLEWVTAGECMAGLHEVVVTKRTIEAIKEAEKANRSLWRISSTLFSSVASDAVMKPLGHFAKSPHAHEYPPVHAGEYYQKELVVIKLNENGKEH